MKFENTIIKEENTRFKIKIKKSRGGWFSAASGIKSTMDS